MSLLTITGLSHSYGDHVLYRNAEFTLNKGEHIGIVGQNGTGKSTLIKICTEQVIPDQAGCVRPWPDRHGIRPSGQPYERRAEGKGDPGQAHIRAAGCTSFR